jgi:hypothetical protein
MAFDPGSSNFFVAEGTSKGAGVWRLHWDAATDTIDGAEQVVFAGLNRVFALALGKNPDSSVYVDFNGRDDTTIHRFDNAGTAAPVSISATPVVGTSATRGLLSMTNLDGALYLAEPTGVTRIANPDAPGAPDAQPVPGFVTAAGEAPNALGADPVNGRVYAGTNNVNGLDRVDVLTVADGSTTAYETGFALVTGIGVRADGGLLVADDPPTSAGAPHAIGESRLFEAPFHDAYVPTVTIASGPAVYSSATAASFAFTSTAAGASFECRLDAAAWAPCDVAAGPDGSHAYAGLLDAVHVFEVRAAAGGHTAGYTFTTDTRAPAVQVDSPGSDKVTDADALRMRFSADEFGVSYACELDGKYVHACEPPVWLRGFAIGKHTFSVTPTDLAGNVGATRNWTFERVERPLAPVPVDPAPVVPGDDSSGRGPAETHGQASSVAPASCRPVAAQRRKGSYKLSGRVLTARITPTAGATYARLALRSRGTVNGNLRKLAVKAVAGTKARDVRVVLTPAQLARLRSRSMVLVVGYGTCSDTFGATTQLAPTAKKSSAR